MKVFVEGHGPVELSQSNFVATGGQASVYVKDGTAFKVYTDPKDAIPREKIQRLSAIADPHVIKPNVLLLDGKNRTIGYAMLAVESPHSLCQLFVPAFRDRMKVPDEAIPFLASRLRAHVLSVHRAKCQIVDLNELNVLVSKDFGRLSLIDVDSYQAEGFPATVIMPSVRDWSRKTFDEKSDWFSYAVLAFQLFLGVHPYKGRIDHPEFAAVPKDDRMEWRMCRSLSAFRSEAKLPPSCPSLDVIPTPFREWLRVVLDEGKRLPPPDLLTTVAPAVLVPAAPRTLSSTGELLLELSEDLGATLLTTSEGFHLLRKAGRVSVVGPGGIVYGGDWLGELGVGRTLLGFTSKLRRAIALQQVDRTLWIYELEEKRKTALSLSIDEVNKSGGCFHVRSGSGVHELEFLELPRRTVVGTGPKVADVLPLASRLFEGCVVQSLLGSTFVSVFPRSKRGHQLRTAELDGGKVLDARFQATGESSSRGGGGVLGVMLARGGKYERLTFRFDERFESYDVRTASDVEPGLVNFVVLSHNGVVADLGTDDVLEVYVAKKDHPALRRIESPVLGRDLRLMKVGDGIGFSRGTEVWRLRLK